MEGLNPHILVEICEVKMPFGKYKIPFWQIYLYPISNGL